MSKKTLIAQLKLIQRSRGGGLPRSEWLASNREILLMQVKNTMRTHDAKEHSPRWNAHLLWQFLDVFLPARTVYYVVRPAMAVMVIVGMVFGGWVTTVSASYNSLPGEYLYAVKIAAENVQVTLAPKSAEPQLHAEFAVRRAQEVAQIVAAPSATPEKVQKVAVAVQNLKNELANADGSLNDLKQSGTKSEVADAAKVVGEKAVEVQKVIDQTKSAVIPSALVTPLAAENIAATSTLNPPAVSPLKEATALNSTLTTATAAADQVSTNAVQVLVDTHKQDQNAVSSADVKSVVEQKIQSVESTVSTVDAQLNVLTATSTLSGSASSSPAAKAEVRALEKIVQSAVAPVKQSTEDAKSALNQAKDLTNTQNFDQALDKLNEVKQIVNDAQVRVDALQGAATSTAPLLQDAPQKLNDATQTTPAGSAVAVPPAGAAVTAPALQEQSANQ